MRIRLLPILVGLMVAGTAGSWTGWAAEKDSPADLPARSITVAFQYPGITLGPDDSVNVDLLIKNRGRSDETVLVLSLIHI